MNSDRHDSLGRMIYLTSQSIRTQIEQLVRPYNLTSEQLHVLKNLDVHLAKSQSELCELTRKNPANITRILDRLEKKSLITRRGNPKDRRSCLVASTDSGHSLTVEMMRLCAPISAEIERGISPEDIAVCKKVLARIDTNLHTLSQHQGDEHE